MLKTEKSPPVTTGRHAKSFDPGSKIQKELSVRIYPDEDPIAGLRRAWGAAVALAEEYHDGPVRGTAKEIHFLRLTAKRLRSFLQLARVDLVEEEFRAENRFLRDTAKSLAGSRDFFMSLRTIERVERLAKDSGERKALEKLRRILLESDEDEVAAAVEPVREETARAVARLRESVGRFGLMQRQPSEWDLLDRGLRRTYERASRNFRKWKKSGDVERAHGCRRFAKYLAFHLELLETKDAEKIRSMRDELGKLQKKLGRMNDIVVLKERVDGLVEAGSVGRKTAKRLRPLLRRARRHSEEASRELGARVFEDGKFSRGLRRSRKGVNGSPGDEARMARRMVENASI